MSVGDTVLCRVRDIDFASKAIRITRVGSQGEAPRTKRPITEFKVGEELDGKVRHVTSFAVWLDIGAEKLAVLPIPDISDAFIAGVSEKLEADDIIHCSITEINFEKQEIWLTSKDVTTIRETARPLAEFSVDEVIQGKVANVTTFGAWIDIGAQGLALLHISDISGKFISDYLDNISEGRTVQCQIKAIVQQRHRIDLVLKDNEGEGARRPIAEFKEGEEGLHDPLQSSRRARRCAVL
eukprot:gnl/MRDRNA2_/MRDRNA2_239379_c0_seq1.p1 gnl/MRDRNA2_/MRDRNA2_239379_c0~~gnl/MRDRNA2_/MRDRNA2_239379_c0_seq1.p1  ORF type:complete len:239 (-),score=43.57 gnl/MRDRNA2_/MRDRNA2_239379_c0_seq1:412-1128(-)